MPNFEWSAPPERELVTPLPSLKQGHLEKQHIMMGFSFLPGRQDRKYVTSITALGDIQNLQQGQSSVERLVLRNSL